MSNQRSRRAAWPPRAPSPTTVARRPASTEANRRSQT
jgi:hypothetical protein